MDKDIWHTQANTEGEEMSYIDDTSVTYDVTFRVDHGMLFDTLHKLNGNTSALGDRLVATLLLGMPDWRDTLGLATYGVEVVQADGGSDE